MLLPTPEALAGLRAAQESEVAAFAHLAENILPGRQPREKCHPPNNSSGGILIVHCRLLEGGGFFWELFMASFITFFNVSSEVV